MNNLQKPKLAGTSLKSLPADLLSDTGADPKALPRSTLLHDGGYAFFLGRLLRKYGIVPRGAIHLGANIGQESVPYMLIGFEKVLYVEAHPSVYAELRSNLDKLGVLENELASYLKTDPVTRFAAVHAAVSDRDGAGSLFVTGSSLFCSTRKPVDFQEWVDYVVERSTPREADEFKGWARDALRVKESIPVPLLTLDTIMREHLPTGWSGADFNVLGMNVQGAELDALRGASESLRHIEMIQTELNYVEHYERNPLTEELDGFLTQAGFEEVAVLRAGPVGTGVYVRRRGSS